MSVTCRAQVRFLLLVIPPQTAAAAAAAATWIATRTGNSSLAAEIFAIAGITPAIPGQTPASQTVDAEETRVWENDGGSAVPA